MLGTFVVKKLGNDGFISLCVLQAEHPQLSNYPSYHTLYDNYNYISKFIDPDYRYHTLLAKIWLLYTVELADTIVLPFNLTRYANRVYDDVVMLELDFQEIFTPQNISLGKSFFTNRGVFRTLSNIYDRACYKNS